MKKVRGMQDVYGAERAKFEFIVEKAKSISTCYGFEEVRTPHLEFSSTFERNLGEESDVVKKEIYKFTDKSGDEVALRPEFTAGVVRAYIENNFHTNSRLFSYGSLFRYERPQKGRFREFNQINFEIFGENGFLSDAETISMAYNLLKSFQIDGKFQLEINTLGSRETMEKYKKALVEYFLNHETSLSLLSKERLKKNPLRILDSKEREDFAIIANVPTIKDYYTQEESEDFQQTLNLLEKLNIPYTINYGIVRGLDYYTGIVFEFTSAFLGAKSTVLAGGRYNKLVSEMGGRDVPAIGFAGGIERLALLTSFNPPLKKMLFILPISENEFEYSLELAQHFRDKKVCSLCLYKGNLGKRIEKILKESYESFALIVGRDEIKTGVFKFKDLAKSEEKSLTIQEVLRKFYD